MRGLLNPNLMRSVYELALEMAHTEFEIFKKDIELLQLLVKKGGTSKALLRKFEFFYSLSDWSNVPDSCGK